MKSGLAVAQRWNDESVLNYGPFQMLLREWDERDGNNAENKILRGIMDCGRDVRTFDSLPFALLSEGCLGFECSKLARTRFSAPESTTEP